jgi:hypothetical protein
MDLGYLKIKIDIQAEHDEYKKKYEYKRRELKREEIKKIFDGFKEFFKADGHFKFKENEHSIMAEYKEHGVKLDMDIYNNVDSPDFLLSGTVTTYEKAVHEFIAEGISSKESTLPPPDVDTQERMIHDTRYYKDFLDGDIEYTFKYRITGRESIYLNMLEVMLAI